MAEMTVEGLYHEWCACRGAVRGADQALAVAKANHAPKACIRALEALVAMLADAEHEAMGAYARALEEAA